MCNASNYVGGAMLGKWIDKQPYVIYYVSITLNDVQFNYYTIEKQLLAITFTFEV